MSNKRGNKKHMTPVGQDFFALGSNTTTGTQPKVPSKRIEAFQSPISSMSSPKRPKLNSPLPQPSMPTVIQQQSIQSSSTGTLSSKSSWEDNAIVVPILELKDKILQCDSENESEEMIERILCGAVKQLREQKTKPDSCLVFTLLYLAKIRPLFFCSPIIVEAFSSLLKREHLIHFKSKSNTVPVLIINLFYHAFHDENSWPETFIKLFIEDSLNDRIWVDNEECKEFVEIIIASFRTKLPPKSLLQTSDVLNPNKQQQPQQHNIDSSSSNSTMASLMMAGEDSVGEDSVSSSTSFGYDHGNKETTMGGKGGSEPAVISRFLDNENQIISYVTEIINENLNRSRPTINDISRNMLKLLIATAGLRNVRLLVAQKLEIWFQNPKLNRPAQDLLLTLFLNCDSEDSETLSYLLKMRLKNKPFNSHFIICFKELLNKKNGTFDIVLKILLTNEYFGNRNMNNYQLILIMFQMNPNDATIITAQFIFKMINSKDENLIRLRSILREIVRIMKNDFINYSLFVQTLIEESKKILLNQSIETTPERIYMNEKIVTEIIDIITLIMFLSANQNVRDAINRPERKEVLRNFQMKISFIQCAAIKWIYDITFFKYEFNSIDFPGLLKKILILEPKLEVYYRLDNWPTETERLLIFRLTSINIPLMQETVQVILAMAFGKKVPLTPQDACELVCTLVQNSTEAFDLDTSNPVLLLNDINIIATLFQCCAYIPPENAKFPENYQKPSLASVYFYWKVWTTLIIIAAHVPKIFGKYAWDTFPTFQALIEMAITNNYQFPPKTWDTEDIQNKLHQFNQMEKMKILEFENYLAVDREINETNSYLLSTLTSIDPTTLPRRPPPDILEDFKLLFYNPNAKESTVLWKLLCQSRDPDFLLMIIDKQRNLLGSQIYLSSLNWLIDLVESYENRFNLLPIECLCEYLLKQIAEELSITSSSSTLLFNNNNNPDAKKLFKNKRRKLIRLIEYFRKDLTSIQQEHGNQSTNSSKAFEYLINYLSHSKSTIRMLAYKSLYVMTSINLDDNLLKLEQNTVPSLFSDEQPEWFQENLIKFLTLLQQQQSSVSSNDHQNQQIKILCQTLSQALSKESDPNLIADYLKVLAKFLIKPDELLITKCSLMLIERKKISNYILMYSDLKVKLKFIESLNILFYNYLENLILIQQVGFIQKIDGLQYFYMTTRNNPRQAVLINQAILHGIFILISLSESFYFQKKDKQQQQPQTKYCLPKLIDSIQIFLDPGCKQREKKLIPEWLAPRLIHTSMPFLNELIINSMPILYSLKFLDQYGVSLKFIELLLQNLDYNLQREEVKLIEKSLQQKVIDSKKLLENLKIYWEKNLTNGKIFAMNFLNYNDDKESMDIDDLDQEDQDDDENYYSNDDGNLNDSDQPLDMTIDNNKNKNFNKKNEIQRSSSSSSSKTLKKSTPTTSNIVFKDLDIERLFETKNFENELHLLTRFLSLEMNDSSVKQSKQFTRIFLDNFHAYMESLIPEINSGIFNSIFNMIINALLKTKYTGLNTELSSIEKTLLTSQAFKDASLQQQTFWKCFQRFQLVKDNQKTKKSIKSSSLVQKSEKKSNKNDETKLEEFLEEVFRDITIGNSSTSDTGEDKMEIEILEIDYQSTKSTKTNKNSSKKSDSKNIKQKINKVEAEHDVEDVEHDDTEDEHSSSWNNNTVVDLAIEKFRKNDIDSEKYDESLFKMIFSRNRPYFLSLLLHRSNFSTLKKCIEFILGKNSNLNSTSVLDFLTICIDSPKLCLLDRENNSQKMIKQEDVLNLNFDQIKSLINYVILENNIKNRIDLILRTCCINTMKTDIVINFLKDNYYDKSKKLLSSELYARLYLQIPNVQFDLFISNDLMAIIQQNPSFMDKITHNLITSFMFVETSSVPVNPQLFQYWELAMLKIAAKHPLLFIRQLPMIPAMLRGKVNVVHYDVFKNLNLSKIFSKLLNMLNLLRPYLWKKNVKGLEQILSLYMDMFMSYYQLPTRFKEPNQELLPLLVQFLRLISDWIKHDSESSNYWIRKHENDFTELSSTYESEQSLFRSIITSNPIQDDNLIIVSEHYQTIRINLKRLQLSNDLLCTTLNDINKMIDKCPSVVENFLNYITPYYTNPFFSELSFTITLKIIKNNPNLIRSVVSSYVKCLQSDYWNTKRNALQILPEFVLLAQDYRYLILRKVFELSITGDNTASLALIDAFRALNTQIGC